MGLIRRSYDQETDFNTLFRELGGNLTDENIRTSAGINISKTNFLTFGTTGDTLLGLTEYGSGSSDQTGITSTTDVTGLSTTITVPVGGRAVRLSGQITIYSGTDNTIAQPMFRESTSTLRSFYANLAGVSKQNLINFDYTFFPAAGSHTYKISLASASGAAITVENSVSGQYNYIMAELV